MKENKMIVFENKEIRHTWYEDEWFFSVVDVVGVLSESANSRNYWNMLKVRELENGIELYTNCVQLKLEAPDDKMRHVGINQTSSEAALHVTGSMKIGINNNYYKGRLSNMLDLSL